MDDNKNKFRDLLEERSKRLGKLIHMSAPDHLIGKGVVLVLQAAMGFCPQECFDCMKELFTAGILDSTEPAP